MRAIVSGDLERLEGIVERGLPAFIEVGKALREIRDRTLYTERGYERWEDYCRERWGMSRPHSYRLIEGARIAALLSPVLSPAGDTRAILYERLLRPLEIAAMADDLKVEAFKEARDLAAQEGVPIQERHVQFAVNELLSPRRRAKARRLEELGKFNVILCDPPWAYDYSFSDSRSVERFYPTMSMPELMLLAAGVRAISAHDALLFMWCPPAFTRKATILMRIWGFSYRTNMVWVKPSIGAGQWVRQQHEMLMLGMRGAFPTPDGTLRPASVILGDRAAHSEKPRVVYDIIEQMYPDVPKVELFARGSRDGWASWGDETSAKT